MLLLPFQQRFAVQRRIHVAGRDGVDADGVGCPFRSEGFGQLGDGGFGGVVGALLLRVQDAGAGDGGEEDDGAAGFGGHHVESAGFCADFGVSIAHSRRKWSCKVDFGR